MSQQLSDGSRAMTIEASRDKKKSSRQVVLVVDNDALVRRSLQMLLRANGYDVLAYASARDLIADPAAKAAVCLVANQIMPDIDGPELLKRLRDTGWTQPAILVTTGGINGAAQGFDRVIEKPLQSRIMLEAIARATTGHPMVDAR